MVLNLRFSEVEREGTLYIYSKNIPINKSVWDTLLPPVREEVIKNITAQIEQEEGITLKKPILIFGNLGRVLRPLNVKN